MSFFQGLFNNTTQSNNNNNNNNNNNQTNTIIPSFLLSTHHHHQNQTSSSSSSSYHHHHHQSKSNSIKSNHHQKQPSLSLRSNLTIDPPKNLQSRRQVEKEDEEVYGPPSPYPSPPLSSNPRLNPHQTFKPASISSTSSPSPSPSPSSPPNLHQASSSTTDELFISEHYPPIQPKQYPFFNETLSSPIGMGKGQLILTPGRSNHNLQSIWHRISRFLSKSNPDLIETLSYPVDQLSLSNLESVLSTYHLSLPLSVKDSLLTHDGQDVFSTSSCATDGLVYGLWLMSSEEIETEYGFWRRLDNGQLPNDAFNATDFSRPNQLHQHQNALQNQMASCPAGWVHEAYSHPGWLPLLTDRVGNYIGVDLSPPMILDPDHDLQHTSNPKGIMGGGQGNSQAAIGQVIAFGREIDEKVVLWHGDGSEGWGKWLSSFADDLEQGNFALPAGSHHHHQHHSKRSSNESSNRDDEQGWKGSSESDDESDEEDGIGELGYFHDGFDSLNNETKEYKTWKLSNEYRGMNVIEALCERSKQRWAEIGLYSSRTPSIIHRQKPSLPPQPRPRPGGSHGNLTHSPHQHPPPGFASGSHASLASQPDTPIAFVTPPSPRASSEQLERQDASSSSNPNLHVVTSSSKQARKRTAPPVPACLALPTMDDLLLAARNLDEHEEDEEGIGLESATSSHQSQAQSHGHGHGQEENQVGLDALGLGNEVIGMSMIKLDERKIEN